MKVSKQNDGTQDFYVDLLGDPMPSRSSRSGISNFFSLLLIFSFGVLAGYLISSVNFSFYNLGFLNNFGIREREYKFDYYNDSYLQKVLDSRAYDFNFYKQIVANLKSKYIDPSKIDDNRLFEWSLKGLVSGVGDPHTVYMDREDYELYKSSNSGSFQGIGVKLGYENNRVVVSSVLKNSPAEKEGVEKGFVFLEVDGVNVENFSIEEVVYRVRGDAGTVVRINFYDPISRTSVVKEIRRATIYNPIFDLQKNGSTLVLQVDRFIDEDFEKWRSEWDRVVEVIEKDGEIVNILIDLRGNGGGFLQSAVYAAQSFLDRGSTVLLRKDRSGNSIEIKTEQSPRIKNKNVIILIDGGTASAAEIFAGSLRYHTGAKIVGTKSYGKGTVQQTLELGNGGALKLTVEYWLLPDGKVIDHDHPIVPDVEIPFDAYLYKQGVDVQLDKALSLFGKD